MRGKFSEPLSNPNEARNVLEGAGAGTTLRDEGRGTDWALASRPPAPVTAPRRTERQSRAGLRPPGGAGKRFGTYPSAVAGPLADPPAGCTFPSYAHTRRPCERTPVDASPRPVVIFPQEVKP